MPVDWVGYDLALMVRTIEEQDREATRKIIREAAESVARDKRRKKAFQAAVVLTRDLPRGKAVFKLKPKV